MAPSSLPSGMTNLPLSVCFLNWVGCSCPMPSSLSKNGGLTLFVTHENHSMSLVLFVPVFLFKIKKNVFMLFKGEWA